MDKHGTRPRAGRSVFVIGTCCGTLTVAAMVSAVYPTIVPLARADGTPVVFVDRRWPAVDTSPPTPGPLEIPTIGAVTSDYDSQMAALESAREAAAATTEPAPPPAPASPAPTENPPAEVPPAPVSSEPPAAAPAPDPAPVDEDPAPSPAAPDAASPADEAPVAEPVTDEQPTTASSPAITPPATTTPVTTAPAPATAPPSEPATAEPTPLDPASPDPTTPAPTTPAPPAPPALPSPPPEQPSGGPLALGERYEQRAADGSLVFAITLIGVDVDLACTDAGSLPPENGHLIGLRVEVLAAAPTASVTAADFRFVGADGVRTADVDTGSSASCLPEEAAWPAGLPGAGQPVAGTLVLDVPAVTGTVVYRPASWPSGLRWQI